MGCQFTGHRINSTMSVSQPGPKINFLAWSFRKPHQIKSLPRGRAPSCLFVVGPWQWSRPLFSEGGLAISIDIFVHLRT